MDRELIQQEILFRRWRDDFAAFCSEAVKVLHPTKGAIPFDLRDPQLESFEAFEDNELVIVLKARQIGWSTLCAVYALWLCLFNEGASVLFLSRAEREAKDLKEKAFFAYQHLPDWLKDRVPTRSNNQLVLRLANDSWLESLPSKKNAARGKTARKIIMDEAAFFEDPAEAWSSIRPAADVGGEIIVVSTAARAGDWFHQTYAAAKAGDNAFKALFYPWNALPDRDEEWFLAQCADMPDWARAREYPENDDEAFVKAGSPVFDTEKLNSLTPSTPKAVGELLFDGEYKILYGGDKHLRVFELPADDSFYVIGADSAEGVEGGDYSVAQVVDRRSGAQVAVWQGHISPFDFANVLENLGYWYNNAFLGVERNNHGHSVLDRLIERGYRNLYYEPSGKYGGGKPGWATSRVSKPVMIDDLDEAILKDLLYIQDRATILELISFSRVQRNRSVTYEGLPHDDLVDALAIAYQMLKMAPSMREAKEEKSDGYPMGVDPAYVIGRPNYGRVKGRRGRRARRQRAMV